MYDIAAGIPSYNEQDSISNVAKQLDTGLKEYFPGLKPVIINMDSSSEDKTREKFMAAPTGSEKKILMEEGVRGKGNMVKMFLEFVQKNDIKYALMVDADLKSITPDWVYLLIKPLLSGYDYCTPLYSRHKYDGTITNLLVYPVVYGLYGRNIRQPIGGDFSFSKRAVDCWLKRAWPESTLYYGVDNFLTTSAVCAGLKISQVKLGAKIHKASGPKLGKMFAEVVDTLFSNVYRCLGHIRGVRKVEEPGLFGSIEEEPQEVSLDCEEIKKKTEEGIKAHGQFYAGFLPRDILSRLPGPVSADDWCRIVYAFLGKFNSENKKTLISALSSLYFARTCSFIEQARGMSDAEAEGLIRENAKIFFNKRELFLENLEQEKK